MRKTLLPILLGIATAAGAQSFDVASIKMSQLTECLPGLCGVTTMPRSGRLIIRNYTLKQLVRTAYSVRTEDISGGPSWCDDDRFDIEAKAGGSVPDERTLFLMLQSTLADRFKLVVHRETKEALMYALVAAKSGSKLQRANSEGGPQQSAGGRGGSGGRGGPGVGTLQWTRDADGNGPISGIASMHEFALFLSRISGRSLIESGPTVLDETNIAGVFDIRLEWLREPSFVGEMDSGLRSAIEDRLGLKLEMRKGPGETLVIDGAEKPSEN